MNKFEQVPTDGYKKLLAGVGQGGPMSDGLMSAEGWGWGWWPEQTDTNENITFPQLTIKEMSITCWSHYCTLVQLW